MKNSLKSSDGKGFPIVLLITVIVLLVGGVVAALLTGFVKVGPTVATSQSGLCANIIADYNSAFEESDAEAYGAKVASSANAASQVKDNQTDPNCVFIQFYNATFTQNANDAIKYADILKSLADDGKYITGQLANPMGIEAIQQSARALTNNEVGKPVDDQEGNG